MEATPNIIEKAEKAVTDILLTLPETMVYHNLNHTWEVVKAADKIGNYANLTEEEKEILMLSAWFHDTGFKFNYDNHEEKSIEIAQEFLEQNNFPAERTEKVISCIISTKIDQKP
ncbi:MAG: HD domain-containing protein, partial [Cyclobacteriaceae bacterium]|nr:HD domain-containing protein [Cyclobacteriaceae bacterium]